MRIALCSKEPLFREGLACLLRRDGSLNLIAEESDVTRCAEAARRGMAEVCVVDGQSLSSEDTDLLTEAQSRDSFTVLLLLPSESGRVGTLLNGEIVIPKISRSEDLMRGLRALPVPRRTGFTRADSRASILARLTYREREMALLVAKGHPNRRIASIMGIQEQSVKNVVSAIMRKLGCENRTQIALLLMELPTPETEQAQDNSR